MELRRERAAARAQQPKTLTAMLDYPINAPASEASAPSERPFAGLPSVRMARPDAQQSLTALRGQEHKDAGEDMGALKREVERLRAEVRELEAAKTQQPAQQCCTLM